MRSRVVRATISVAILAVSLGPARAVPPLVAGALSSGNVDLVATIPDAGAIGARIIGQTMYVTGAQGVRIYDISSGIPIPKGALELPHFENEDVDTNGRILLIAADHALGLRNVLYVIDVSNPALPVLRSVLQTSTGHTAACILDCKYAWVSGSGPGIAVVDLTDPSHPHQVGTFAREIESHAVNVDETGIAWVSAWDGLYAYDITDYGPQNLLSPRRIARDENPTFHNTFIIHNSLRPRAREATPETLADDKIDPGEVVVVTEENWLALSNNMCHGDGQFQTGWYRVKNGRATIERLDALSIGRGTVTDTKKPAGLVACSSHFFDEKDGIVADGWYEQGLRFFDVSDPHRIRQVGYYMPAATEVWAAKFHTVGSDTYVYTMDLVRGIDVLRFSGKAGDPVALATRYNPNTTSVSSPSREWGYLCRIAHRPV